MSPSPHQPHEGVLADASPSHAQGPWGRASLAATPAQIRSREAFLERLIEVLPVSLFTKDPRDDFRITSVNRCFEEMFGIRRDEIVGKVDGDLFDEELSAHYRKEDLAVFGDGAGQAVEERIETARGPRTARTIKIPLYGEDGSPELLIGMVQDVEDDIAARRAAEDVASERARFLANVSHEVRTPIHGILGMLDMAIAAATDCDSSSPDTLAALKSARSSASTLSGTIMDLLDFGDLDAGRCDLKDTPFSLALALSSALEPMRAQADDADVMIARVDGNGEPIADCSWADLPELVGDAAAIQRVVSNLVSNAIKFSDAGEEVRVAITYREMRGTTPRIMLRIEVQDDGCGIRRSELEHVFGAFQQADHEGATLFRGTGLGLTIVRQLVERMGGKIEIESEENVGSNLRVEIPMAVHREATAALPAPVAPAPRQIEKAPRPLSVLVAEDNRVNQKIMMSMLARAGHTILLAQNGAEAVELYRKEGSEIDLVLMDIQMPILDGHAAMRQIRKLEKGEAGPTRHIPIIAVTANAMEGDDEVCFTAGADGYLPKPVSLDQLVAEMSRCTAQAS